MDTTTYQCMHTVRMYECCVRDVLLASVHSDMRELCGVVKPDGKITLYGSLIVFARVWMYVLML